MLDSNVDDELALLGQVPNDVPAIVTRWLGERPLTLDEFDSLLASLAEVAALPALDSVPLARGPAPDGAPAPKGTTPANTAVASEPEVVASTPAAVVTSAPALEPESPLSAASAAPLLDPTPVAPSDPPPVFESRPAPVEPPSVTPDVFDEKDGVEDPEAQAQAIVAAFERPEVDESSTEALAAELESSLNELEASNRAVAAENAHGLDTERALRKPERSRGSRRPDLNELLDQPLDALDFERTEPTDESEDAPGAQARHSELPTGAPPPPASGDDFEILVDDEILEIAEDDVEMVNDDEESN